MIAAVDVRAFDVCAELAPDEVEVRRLPDGRDAAAFLLPDWGDRGTLEALPRLERLRVVQLMSAGTDWIEASVPAWATLCNARGARDAAVAEWVVGALLGDAYGQFTAARTRRWSDALPRELQGATVLVVGFGSIGREVKRLLEPFGVTVIGVARQARHGVHGTDELPALIERADAVVVLAPLMPDTTGLVDAGLLARMRDGALLVNAGRGGVVDTSALVAELQSGRLRAVLDVVDPEPLPEDHPLWELALAITPHNAGDTEAADERAVRLGRAARAVRSRGAAAQCCSRGGVSDSALSLTRTQVVAFRIARHHLVERLGPDGAQAAAVVGLQDTPPGTALLALAARADVVPDALDELVLVPSVRGAPLAVAERDLAVFTAGLEPPDEEAAKAVVGNAWKSLDGFSAMDALDRVSEAVHERLRDGPRARDDFHQALRERLPRELLWWCRGCGSHHVHPSLWRATGIRGVLAIVGREGRSPVFGLPPKAPKVADPGAELARRFLRSYGPARPRLLAEWAGLATSHATELWERAGPLVRVDLEGRRAWALAEDEPRLANPPRADGVRLLPNLDPLNAGRDRDVLVSDPAVRKRIWKSLGGPGTALVSGEVAGLWRPTKKGKKLLVTVEPLDELATAATDELAAEAERIAPFRGADAGELRLGTV